MIYREYKLNGAHCIYIVDYIEGDLMTRSLYILAMDVANRGSVSAEELSLVLVQ